TPVATVHATIVAVAIALLIGPAVVVVAIVPGIFPIASVVLPIPHGVFITFAVSRVLTEVIPVSVVIIAVMVAILTPAIAMIIPVPVLTECRDGKHGRQRQTSGNQKSICLHRHVLPQ